MNQTDFERYTKYLLSKSADLLISKGSEYAGSEDRLSNFKRGAAATGVSQATVAFIYLTKHLDAVASYLRDPSRPLSEPIEGRLCDLLNYVILLAAILHEEKCRNAIPAAHIHPENA